MKGERPMKTKTLVLPVLFVCACVHAETYTWNGGASGAWNTTENWMPNGTPGVGDLAYFPAATDITDDFAVGVGTLEITNAAGTVSFKGVISGAGKLKLEGCGEKRLYRDNTFTGGMEIYGTGYRTDGTLIAWNGGVFGDSGAVRIYSGGALGVGKAVFDRDEGADTKKGYIYNTGCRLYIEGDMTVTTPLDIGFNRDGNPQIFLNATDVTFAETVSNSGARNSYKFTPNHGKLTFSKYFKVNGYFSVFNGEALLPSDFYVGTMYSDAYSTIRLAGKGSVNYMWYVLGKVVCETTNVLDFAHGNAGASTHKFYADSSIDLNGYRQTVTSTTLPFAMATGFSVTSPDYHPAQLVFDGLSTGVSNLTVNAAFKGSAGLCWNPASSTATLTLTGTPNPTTGELTVSNGVVRLTGAAFSALSRVMVCAGAKLALDDASLAAFRTTRLFVDSQGEVELGSSVGGMAVIGRVTIIDHDTGVETNLPYNGRYGASGTAGATAVAQFSGPGVVSVPTPTTTYWEKAEDGAWSTAANWSFGIPSLAVGAEISAAGADYTVTAGGVSATNLTVKNLGGGTTTLALNGDLALENARVDFGAGGRLDVPAGKRFSYDGSNLAAGRTDTVLSLTGGAEWNVAGEAVFTNVTGALVVGGGAGSATSRVSVTGNGVFAFHTPIDTGTKGKGYFYLMENGLVDVSGYGTLRRDVPDQKEYFAWSQHGGTMLFRDHATYDAEAVWENCFGSGVTRFTDDAAFVAKGDDVYARVYFGSTVAGVPVDVSFEDRAAYRGTTGTFTEIKPSNGGRAVVRFDSDAEHEVGYLLVGRANAGMTDIYISRGHVKVGNSQGMLFAGGANIYANYSCYATGTVHVTGGAITIDGSSGAWSVNYYGLVVGDGKAEPGPVEAYGRIELSGGAITNSDSRGNVVLGTGRGRGEFVQTGGDYYANITHARTFAVFGVQNGEGLYALSNGTARIRNRVWVGGATTNDLHRVFYEDRSGLTDAKGQLTIAAADLSRSCSFAAEGPTVFGALGTGILDMGPGGRFDGTDMTFSNNTASVFRTRVTNDGAGLVNLTGRLTIADGAKFEVDASAITLKKGHFPLVKCAEMEGAFNPENVTINAPRSVQVGLRTTTTGIDLVIKNGMVLNFR